MKEKFDRNKQHKNIKDINPKEHTNFDSFQAALNYMDYLHEHYIEESVKNDKKPQYANFKDYQDINMNIDYADLVFAFQKAIKDNKQSNINYYGKQIIEYLVKNGHSKEEILETLKNIIPVDGNISLYYPIENNKVK